MKNLQIDDKFLSKFILTSTNIITVIIGCLEVTLNMFLLVPWAQSLERKDVS